jgi:hypothetical protein
MVALFLHSQLGSVAALLIQLGAIVPCKERNMSVIRLSDCRDSEAYCFNGRVNWEPINTSCINAQYAGSLL